MAVAGDDGDGAGQTFRYTDRGPVGLLEGKKAYLVLSSDGVYSEGPASDNDYLGTYLTSILGLMGITDVEIVRVEGVALGQERDAAQMRSASERIRKIADGASRRGSPQTFSRSNIATPCSSMICCAFLTE